jgi:hypothetical protein
MIAHPMATMAPTISSAVLLLEPGPGSPAITAAGTTGKAIEATMIEVLTVEAFDMVMIAVSIIAVLIVAVLVTQTVDMGSPVKEMAMVTLAVAGMERLVDSAEVKWAAAVDSAVITVMVDSMVATDPMVADRMVADRAAVVTDNRDFSAFSIWSTQSKRLAADVASRFRSPLFLRYKTSGLRFARIGSAL